MSRRGCNCCIVCREFEKRWCGIASTAEATTAGVTKTGINYSIDYDLRNFDWAAIVTFPKLTEPASYYAGGVCDEGTDWTGGQFQHDIILTRNSDSAILLKLRLTIYHSVAGVDDYVKIEVLETSNNFTAVLPRDYTLSDDANTGRYIPTMTITRREGITAIQFQDELLLVDPVADGTGWDSLTKSYALYAETEGISTDTARISFESTWISGEYADATGDWIVFGYEIANPPAATQLECPDPRICAVNDSTYSTPQWTTSNLNISIDGATEQALDWLKVFDGCTVTLTQPDRKTITLPTTGSDSFAPDYFGKFYAVADPISSPYTRFTYYPSGILNIQSIAPLTDAWTRFDANQSFTEGISPEIVVTLLPSTTAGKRKVRAEMVIPVWFDLIQQDGFVTGSRKLLLFDGRDGGVVPDFYPNIFNRWYDPPLADQIAHDYVSADLIGAPYGYFDYGSTASFRIYNPSTATFGAATSAPTSLCTETVVSPPSDPAPVYSLVVIQNFSSSRYRITWEKEIDEWDGAAPTVSMTASDIVLTSTGGFDPVTAARIITAASLTFDTTSSVTVRYVANPASLGELTYTKPAYLFDLSLTVETVDLTAATITITPTTGPMPQPA